MLTIKDKVRAIVPTKMGGTLDSSVDGIIVEMRLCGDDQTIEYKVRHSAPTYQWFLEEHLTKIEGGNKC